MLIATHSVITYSRLNVVHMTITWRVVTNSSNTSCKGPFVNSDLTRLQNCYEVLSLCVLRVLRVVSSYRFTWRWRRTGRAVSAALCVLCLVTAHTRYSSVFLLWRLHIQPVSQQQQIDWPIGLWLTYPYRPSPAKLKSYFLPNHHSGLLLIVMSKGIYYY